MAKQIQPRRPRKRRVSPQSFIKPYVVQQAYTTPKQSDRTLRDKVGIAFSLPKVREALASEENMSSDLIMKMYFSPKEGKVKYAPKDVPNGARFSVGEVLSASLGLYRTICLFPAVRVMTFNSDTTPWAIFLKHVVTGEFIMITEHKGAFRIKTSFSNRAQAPAAFFRDVVFLLQVLCSEQCPHPYDSTVSGNVA